MVNHLPIHSLHTGSPNHSGICDHQNAVTSDGLRCGAVKHIENKWTWEWIYRNTYYVTYQILKRNTLLIFVVFGDEHPCKNLFTNCRSSWSQLHQGMSGHMSCQPLSQSHPLWQLRSSSIPWMSDSNCRLMPSFRIWWISLCIHIDMWFLLAYHSISKSWCHPKISCVKPGPSKTECPRAPANGRKENHQVEFTPESATPGTLDVLPPYRGAARNPIWMDWIRAKHGSRLQLQLGWHSMNIIWSKVSSSPYMFWGVFGTSNFYLTRSITKISHKKQRLQSSGVYHSRYMSPMRWS